MNSIAAATTRTGPTVRAALDTGTYDTGSTVTDATEAPLNPDAASLRSAEPTGSPAGNWTPSSAS